MLGALYAIARPSVCPCVSTDTRLPYNLYSVTWVDQSKTVEVRIMKFSLYGSLIPHINIDWLDVPERVKFKLVSMVHNCFHHKAPRYLMDYCIPISSVANRQHLRSARHHYRVVPLHSLSS